MEPWKVVLFQKLYKINSAKLAGALAMIFLKVDSLLSKNGNYLCNIMISF